MIAKALENKTPENLPGDDKGQQHADEGRDGIVCAGLRRAQITLSVRLSFSIHYNKVILWITRSRGFVNTNFSSIGSELCAFSESNTSALPSFDKSVMPTVC